MKYMVMKDSFLIFIARFRRDCSRIRRSQGRRASMINVPGRKPAAKDDNADEMEK